MKRHGSATKTTYNKLNRLRNLLWHVVRDQKPRSKPLDRCFECHKKFTDKEIADGLITAHHKNGTPVTSSGKAMQRKPENIVLSHPSCHKSIHMKEHRHVAEKAKKYYKELRMKGWTDEEIRELIKKKTSHRHVGRGSRWGG